MKETLMTEQDEKLLEQDIIETLTGTQVSVQGLTRYMEPLTREGAEQVLDKLRARGFKVVRV
jgi:hypothetical protein